MKDDEPRPPKGYIFSWESPLFPPDLTAPLTDDDLETDIRAWMDGIRGNIRLSGEDPEQDEFFQRTLHTHREDGRAKRIVEDYLLNPWRTQGDEYLAQLRVVRHWGYRYAGRECPILLPGESLPADTAGVMRWLTFSTEAWAQQQYTLNCHWLADPQDDSGRLIHPANRCVSVSPADTVICEDDFMPYSDEVSEGRWSHWPTRKFYLGKGFHPTNQQVSAVIMQWVEEPEDTASTLTYWISRRCFRTRFGKREISILTTATATDPI